MQYLKGTFLYLWIAMDLVLPLVAKILVSEGYTFEGDGFLRLARGRFRPRKASSVQLSFKTRAENGLLFFVGAAGEYMSIEMRDGRLIYRYDLGNTPLVLISPFTYNDGEWHRIQAKRARANGMLKVDGNVVSRGRPPGGDCGTLQELSITNEVFIAGINKPLPSTTITSDGFEGCIKNVQLGSYRRNLDDYLEAVGMRTWCRWPVEER